MEIGLEWLRYYTDRYFRRWIACNCYCNKCKTYHTCFRPEYFLPGEEEAYCCRRKGDGNGI